MPTIDVNSTRLAYDEVGDPDGVPLLLSHSLFFTRRMFDPLIAHLGDGHRVVAYDHRGQGESAAAPVEQLDMDTLTEDAAALIEALDLGPCHVVGNSMGGFIALRLAARRPDLVRSAVAVGSSAEEEHSLPAFAPLVAHLQEHGTADVIDTLMHIMFGDTSLAQPSAQTQAWREHMLGLDRSIGDAAHQVIHRSRLVEELAGCAVPVLAIAGAEDHAYPPPLSSEALGGSERGAQRRHPRCRALGVAGAERRGRRAPAGSPGRPRDRRPGLTRDGGSDVGVRWQVRVRQRGPLDVVPARGAGT